MDYGSLSFWGQCYGNVCKWNSSPDPGYSFCMNGPNAMELGHFECSMVKYIYPYHMHHPMCFFSYLGIAVAIGDLVSSVSEAVCRVYPLFHDHAQLMGQTCINMILLLNEWCGACWILGVGAFIYTLYHVLMNLETKWKKTLCVCFVNAFPSCFTVQFPGILASDALVPLASHPVWRSSVSKLLLWSDSPIVLAVTSSILCLTGLRGRHC